MTKNCDYGVKLPKNKLNTPTTKWAEEDSLVEVLKEIASKTGYSFNITVDDNVGSHIYLDMGIDVKEPKTIFIKVSKDTMCHIPYPHDFASFPCEKCHVGGRISWWWKVIKSWYFKI